MQTTAVTATQPAAEATQFLVWENRHHDFLRAYLLTVLSCVLRPSQTFSRIPRHGDIFAPLQFALINIIPFYCVIAWAFSLDLVKFWLKAVVFFMPATSAQVSYFGMFFIGTACAVLMSILSLLYSIAFHHVSVSILQGNNHGVEVSFRALAYATAYCPVVLFLIPLALVNEGLFMTFVLFALVYYPAVSIARMQEIEFIHALAIYVFKFFVYFVVFVLSLMAAGPFLTLLGLAS